MTGQFARLHVYRWLFWSPALAEMRTRHRQIALVMVWDLAQPVSMMMVMITVFSAFIKPPVEAPPCFLFAYTGLLTLLPANTASNGLPSIDVSMNLVTKSNLFLRESGADGEDISISLEYQDVGKIS